MIFIWSAGPSAPRANLMINITFLNQLGPRSRWQFAMAATADKHEGDFRVDDLPW